MVSSLWELIRAISRSRDWEAARTSRTRGLDALPRRGQPAPRPRPRSSTGNPMSRSRLFIMWVIPDWV